MLQQKYDKAGILATIFVCFAMVAISSLLIINKQYVIDQITVWQYQPTSEVLGLVEKAGMNSYGEFLYLASQPKLDATQDFNTECDRVENVTSILGCYSDYRIYIYDVTDSQLDGIREVTAAHETLHAAYIRMGDEEKNKVDDLLEAEYKKLEGDEKFADLMEFYDRSEPGQRYNELHSIIGVEVDGVSDELEVHYEKYFSDRHKVLALNTKYSSVFKELENRADELTAQLNELTSNISSMTDQYNADVTALNNDIISFNQRANAGNFSSQWQFDSEKATLSARVAKLEAARSTINDSIAKYNELLAEYNSIASQSKKLNNSVDSTLAPAPSV